MGKAALTSFEQSSTTAMPHAPSNLSKSAPKGFEDSADMSSFRRRFTPVSISLGLRELTAPNAFPFGERERRFKAIYVQFAYT